MLTLISVALVQLGTAHSAQAATLCKNYDGYSSEIISTPKAGRLCAAPSTDYPSYRGWVRITDGNPIVNSNPSVCGFSLFPYDSDDIRPLMACPAIAGPFAPTWKWTGTRWVADGATGMHFMAGSRAYVYPMSGSWRWIWNEQDGWRAVEARWVALRWFTPAA
jgi:hypothetical protein